MRSHYRGTCPHCGGNWEVGAEIEKWCGSWLHRKCKLQARSALEGGASAIIPTRSDVQRYWEGKRTVRPKADFGKSKARKLS